MDNYHSHAYSPIKRSTPPTSHKYGIGLQPHTGGGGTHGLTTHSNNRTYVPADGSQLSLKSNSSDQWRGGQFDGKLGEVKSFDIIPMDTRTQQDRDVQDRADADQGKDFENVPAFKVYETQEYRPQHYAVGPYSYAKIEDSRIQRQDIYVSRGENSEIVKNHMANHDQDRAKTINKEDDDEKSYYNGAKQYQEPVRVNTLPDSNKRRSVDPKKSSLLDRFAKKKDDVYVEPQHQNRILVDQPPKLLPMSKLPDSYVDRSNSFNQDAFMEAEELYGSRKVQYESIKKEPNVEVEYFSFSPEPVHPDKWANGSTPSPSKLLDSKLFFSSQDDNHKADAGFEKSYKNKSSEDNSELKKETEILKNKLETMANYSKMLESQLIEKRNSGMNSHENESDWQIERKEMSEKFKLIKLQSQQIADQADEYKKVADGYIGQLEAKACHHDKELKLKEETIRRLQQQIADLRNNQGTPNYQSSTPLNSDFNLAISRITVPFIDFFKELDMELQRALRNGYSNSLVTHILTQITQLSKNPSDYYTRENPVIELSNLKVLFLSFTKVICSKINTTSITPNRPSIDSQGMLTDRSVSREQTSVRSSVTAASKRDPNTMKKIIEENQRMAIEYSKLKEQNKSLKDQIDELVNKPSRQYNVMQGYR